MANNSTLDPLSIAYYCTGHGLGHATRSIEVCKHLVERGHSVTVVTGAPARVFLQEVPSARFVLRKAVLDAGSKQLDPFTVDVRGSLEDYYNTVVLHRTAMLEGEVQWLQSNHFDLVVSDVVPIVCAAAAAAGIPAVCVSNFSWDFIYSEYLTAQRKTQYKQLVWQIAQDYASAALLLRLPGYVPMPAFTAIEDVPLVVRHARRFPAQVRQELGLPADARLAVLIHGGHKAELPVREDFLPPGWVCVACNGGRPLSPTPLPANFRLAPADVYTPDLVAACDCVIGKIGYGTMSECLAHSRPLVFVRRDFFNEEPFLRKMLEVHGAAVEMKRRDFLEGHWGPYLLRACSLKVNYNAPTNGAEVVAQRLEQVARGQTASGAVLYNPMTHLRDTVVFGYLMASPKNGRVDVPDWYVNGADPNRRLGSYRNLTEVVKTTPGAAGIPPLLHDWQLLEGDVKLLQQLPDTLDFLQLLHQLDSTANCSSSGQPPAAAPAAAAVMAATSGDPPASSVAPSAGGTPATAGTATKFSASDLPEVRAARGLFRWDDEILVTRAPGRLDVLGGIADYSGSLVLQMPIAEACHVALQLHPLNKQTVWKHIQARHEKLGGPRPALRVVSYHADDTNRAPTFDIDLDDLFEPDGSPIPYESLQRYFKKDPPVSWGGYVAGCLLVLAREKGLKFPDGISILVCSDVPEGKGVSSSAALEVAVMSALTAALHCQLSGRELALLCQKAENLVVGAPCGVMDQMTSCLGEAGQLLALLCQPAELQGGVPIPPQIRFWGIDSGIRHSVGGSDYASVRVGTFMGLKIVSEVGRRQQLMLQSNPSSSLAPVMTEVVSRLPQATTSSSGGWSGQQCTAASAVSDSHSHHCVAQGQQDHQQQQQQQQQDQLGQGIVLPASCSTVGRRSAGYLPSVGCYLANIAPSQFRELYEQELPIDMLGRDFMSLYGPHLDRVTSIEPAVRYAVRSTSAHPVHENCRVNCFRALLVALAAAGSMADVDPDAGDGSGGGAGEAAGVVARASSGITGTGADGHSSSQTGNHTVTCGGAQQQQQQEEEQQDEEQQEEEKEEVVPLTSGEPGDELVLPAQQGSDGSSDSTSQCDPQASRPAASPALLGPLETLGELMFQSHASYTACGLGSDGTNRIVNIVREHMAAAYAAGRPPALYGAKITGGGCGGTVCVMGLAGSAGQAAIDAVVMRYQQETGYSPLVFAGSSIGSLKFGHLRLIRRNGK